MGSGCNVERYFTEKQAKKESKSFDRSPPLNKARSTVTSTRDGISVAAFDRFDVQASPPLPLLTIV